MQTKFKIILLVTLLAGLLLTGCNGFAYQRISNGQPVGWGCATVHYRIDVSGMPSLAWGQHIHDAFRAASTATGIPVHYDGRLPAGYAATHGWQSSPGDPVWVGYKPFDDPPDASSGFTEPTFSGNRITGGEIWFNTLWRWTRTNHKQAVWHEVGHLFGLAHPTDRTNQVMGFIAHLISLVTCWALGGLDAPVPADYPSAI